MPIEIPATEPAGDNESHEIVRMTTPSDTAMDAAAAVATMVPLLGGAISNVLSGLSNDRKLRRINEVLWAMSEELKDLSEESEKYVTTDEFQDLLDETLHKVYEERSEEKRHLYKDFLVDEIREPWGSWQEQHRFLRTLESVQPPHLAVLRALLAETEAQGTEDGDVRGVPATALDQRLPGIDPSVTEEVVDELIAFGLVRNQGLETWDANFSAVLTRYGMRFISYIVGKDIAFTYGPTGRGGPLGGRIELVDREFTAVPLPVEGLAQMVMLARPLGFDERLLQAGLRDVNPAIWLEEVVQEAQGELPFNEIHYLPEVAGRGLWRRRLGAWAATTDLDGSARPGSVKQLRVDDDGSVHLFLDRVGAVRDDGGPVLVFERAIAETAIHFCATVGALYARVGFDGPVVIGLGVRGLQGGESWALNHAMRGATALEEAEYRKEIRSDAKVLAEDPVGIARQLTAGLMEALTQRRYDPFERPLA
jgi:hypothetical protein